MNDPIKVKIGIVLAQIKTFESNIYRFNDKYYQKELKEKLEKEQKNLEDLKLKYPEYFI